MPSLSGQPRFQNVGRSDDNDSIVFIEAIQLQQQLVLRHFQISGPVRNKRTRERICLTFRRLL
jgi:hypothetical protein